MTDPVTNMEIEDVLSSIRRLVSENARGEAAPRAPEPQETKGDEADGAGAGPAPADDLPDEAPEAVADVEPSESGDALSAGPMLVLTPALRVGEAPETDDAPEGPAGNHTENHTENHTGDDSGAPDGAEAEAIAAAIETALEEAAAPMLRDAVEDEVSAALSDSLSEDAREEVAEEALQLDPGFRHVEPETSELEDRIAELEAAVAAREDDWEPDGITESDNDAAPVDPPAEALAWEDREDDAGPQGRGWDAAEPDEIEEAELIGETGAEAPSDIEAGLASIAALTAAANARRAARGGAEDRADADPVADLSREDEVTPDLLAESDTILDEDMLRELVADIVRQELQGSLGERITRNVRKLVRREIHRALTAREME